MERTEIISRIYSFLDKIGIEVKEKIIIGEVFMPGLTIEEGKLVVDPEALKYPGDLLHEAGHIAVTKADKRKFLSGAVPPENKGDEMAVLIWSYFAAREAGISPAIVFHNDGYKGQGDWLLENFENKIYIGLPLIEWMQILKKQEDGSVKVISWLRN